MPDLSKPVRFLRTEVLPSRAEKVAPNVRHGVIYGVSAVTRGEAVTHDVWLDQTFVKSVVDAINESSPKVRFSHPGMSSDGLGKYLGRATNGRLSEDGQRALCDLRFAQSAHHTPNGNLAEYVMELARTDSESCGFSIVFESYKELEDEFAQQHSESPDPLNTRNLRHARLRRLRAVDLVDEPSANPAGMFSAAGVVIEAEELAAYVCGVGDKPNASQFAVDPDRVRLFFRRFLNRHNLSLVKEAPVPTDIHDPVEVPATATVEETPTTEAPPVAIAEPVAEPQPATAELSRREQSKPYLELFGDEVGSRYFAAGITLSEAKDRYIASLKADYDDLQKRFAALEAAGAEHVPHSHVRVDGTGRTRSIRIAGR